jgi:ribose transport system ATP-binding protein
MTAALEVGNLSKTFGGRRVLNRVSTVVEAGEIMGLVGQNGSGKSTLIKILSGVYEPDEGGSMAVLGRSVPLPVKLGRSSELGLAFVHQDLGLFLDGSVLENMAVGRYKTGFGGSILWSAQRKACRTALARIGLYIDPEVHIRELSQVDRALIAIARAVDQAWDAASGGVIILDEPTSYLPRDAVTKLFKAVRELKTANFGIIFVSHRIDEVLELCDTITILREGESVAHFNARAADQDQIIEAMLGRPLQEFYPEATQSTPSEQVLVATEIAGQGVDGVNFFVRKGEIFGITGLLGMGQERLFYLLIGAYPASGLLELGHQRFELKFMTPRIARDARLMLLPSDRLQSSGVQEATLMENMTLATLYRYVTFGTIRHVKERAAARALAQEFDVRPPDPDRPMRTFSGGNQQKALLAKWLDARPAVLLMHEPTQGVDIGAKQQIFRQLRLAADAGVSIVIATTEYEDLSRLCDRVMVMRDGRNVIELEGESLTRERLVEECYRTDGPCRNRRYNSNRTPERSMAIEP